MPAKLHRGHGQRRPRDIQIVANDDSDAATRRQAGAVLDGEVDHLLPHRQIADGERRPSPQRHVAPAPLHLTCGNGFALQIIGVAAEVNHLTILEVRAVAGAGDQHQRRLVRHDKGGCGRLGGVAAVAGRDPKRRLAASAQFLRVDHNAITTQARL